MSESVGRRIKLAVMRSPKKKRLTRRLSQSKSKRMFRFLTDAKAAWQSKSRVCLVIVSTNVRISVFCYFWRLPPCRLLRCKEKRIPWVFQWFRTRMFPLRAHMRKLLGIWFGMVLYHPIKIFLQLQSWDATARQLPGVSLLLGGWWQIQNPPVSVISDQFANDSGHAKNPLECFVICPCCEKGFFQIKSQKRYSPYDRKALPVCCSQFFVLCRSVCEESW